MDPAGCVCVWFCFFWFCSFCSSWAYGAVLYVGMSLCRDVSAVVDGVRTVFSTKTVERSIGRSIGRSVAVASRRVGASGKGRPRVDSIRRRRRARARESANERVRTNES